MPKTNWMSVDSADLDQIPHFVASDLGLHCLLRPVCHNTLGKHGKICKKINKAVGNYACIHWKHVISFAEMIEKLL